MKLSPWWDKDTKPIHAGVYDTITTHNDRGFSLWTGNSWNDTCESIEEARKCNYLGLQNKKWRGINK